MLGVNVFSGSHFDQYTVEFTYWSPLYSPLVLRYDGGLVVSVNMWAS